MIEVKQVIEDLGKRLSCRITPLDSQGTDIYLRLDFGYQGWTISISQNFLAENYDFALNSIVYHVTYPVKQELEP